METNTASISFSDRIRPYFEVLKFRLSTMVVFSSGMTYLLASGPNVEYSKLWLLVLGGFMVTGSANIINQVFERDIDSLMKRTRNRPLPTGRMSVAEAVSYSSFLGIAGFAVLALNVNLMAALLTMLSLVLYGFVYTPMKQRSPLAVAVGAVPGALPTLIGWVAYTGQITIPGLILFGIQFVWQFPHFWAIAWVLDDDYKKAGFRLLPSSGGRDIKTAFRIMSYTLFLIPLGLMPFQLGITGSMSAMVVTLCGTLFLFQTFSLMASCSNKAAKSIMFGSFLYLPIVQIAFVLDRV
ncbi:MAG: heme o synthase [Bacteroidota bacterium]